MKRKTQILMIHGGTTFKSRKDLFAYLKNKKVSLEKKKIWALDYFDENLSKTCEFIRPIMPVKEDARYIEWKVHFEKYFPFLNDGIILIGSSLGGIFLAKYLSENKFPKKILSVYLVAPPFDNSCPGEDLVGGFKLKKDLSLIETNSNNVCLMFSKDDPCVPISHAEKYRKKLKSSKIIIYKSKNGHFILSKFPEIVKMIKRDISLVK